MPTPATTATNPFLIVTPLSWSNFAAGCGESLIDLSGFCICINPKTPHHIQ
jgi:hypothetical protein